MALHEVQLKGYSVRPGNLSLGTFGSYGIEQLHVTLDATWSGLAVTATFHPPKGEPREIRLPENGLIDVPAEATANEGTGTIVYCGVANGVQRITKTQGYNVITRGPVGGTEPFKPSESLATQVLQAALNAEKNSAEAKSVADNLRNDAANGKFDGKDGAKGDKGDKGDPGQNGSCSGYFCGEGYVPSTHLSDGAVPLYYREMHNRGGLISYNGTTLRLKKGHTYSVCVSGMVNASTNDKSGYHSVRMTDGYDDNYCRYITLIEQSSRGSNSLCFNRIYDLTGAKNDVELKFSLEQGDYKTYLLSFRGSVTIIALD